MGFDAWGFRRSFIVDRSDSASRSFTLVVPSFALCGLAGGPDDAGHDGMQVPMRGEVAWLLPAGARPYWRGTITALAYEFAR